MAATERSLVDPTVRDTYPPGRRRFVVDVAGVMGYTPTSRLRGLGRVGVMERSLARGGRSSDRVGQEFVTVWRDAA